MSDKPDKKTDPVVEALTQANLLLSRQAAALDALVRGLTPSAPAAAAAPFRAEAIDFPALKVEIETDPQGVGYAPYVASGQDSLIADLLNARTGRGAGTVPNDPIPADRFIASLDATELTLLTTLQLAQIQVIATAANVDIADADIQNWVALVWPSGTTKATLNALATRAASRAEVLFGAGTTVSQGDVSFALRGVR